MSLLPSLTSRPPPTFCAFHLRTSRDTFQSFFCILLQLDSSRSSHTLLETRYLLLDTSHHSHPTQHVLRRRIRRRRSRRRPRRLQRVRKQQLGKRSIQQLQLLGPADIVRVGRSPPSRDRHQWRSSWMPPILLLLSLSSSPSARSLSPATALASLAFVGQAGGHVLAAIT